MFTDLAHRLRSLIRRRSVEEDLHDELHFHFERLVDRHLADGLPHDKAMRRARLELGGFDQIKEEHRDARGVRLLEDVGSDLRYAIRQVKRSPGFAVLAVLSLETGMDPAAMVLAVRETLLAMRQNIRVYALRPLSTYIDQSFTGVRWMAMVLSGFGLLALVLAAIGLYGVIAYRVSLRTQEIGVRMALGAGRGAIFRDVLWRGLAIAVAGVVIGEVLAIPASRALASVQASIRPAAPSAHVAAAVIWVAVALLACYVPASRASRVDPMTALRHE